MAPPLRFDIVAALDLQGGIGRAGGIPWQLPGDRAHFKRLTTGTQASSTAVVQVGASAPSRSNPGKTATGGRVGAHAVVMGRKTWESLPAHSRPLAQRINVVMTRNAHYPLPSTVYRAARLDEAFDTLSRLLLTQGGAVFVIGGSEVFAEALRSPRCHQVHLTRIMAAFACDVFFPELGPGFELVARSPVTEEKSLRYFFEIYRHSCRS